MGATLLVVGLAAFWPVAWAGLSSIVLVAGASMEPTLNPGDAVYALKLPGQYEVGDIIVFTPTSGGDNPGAARVIHRIVEVTPSGEYVTKGDNKPAPDPWRTPRSDVDGVVISEIPVLGFIMSSVPRPVVLGVVAAVAVLVLMWPARSSLGKHADRTQPGRHRVR